MTKTLITIGFCLFTFTASAQQDQTSKGVFPKPRQVQNESELKPHIGALLGVTQPEGSWAMAGEIGLDIGFQPYIPFGLGLELSRSEIASDVERMERNQALAKFTYNFGGYEKILRNSYVGLGAGAVFRRDSSRGVVAPLVGFDFPVGTVDDPSALSFGLNAKYAVVDGDEDPDGASISGVMKYWY